MKLASLAVTGEGKEKLQHTDVQGRRLVGLIPAARVFVLAAWKLGSWNGSCGCDPPYVRTAGQRRPSAVTPSHVVSHGTPRCNVPTS